MKAVTTKDTRRGIVLDIHRCSLNDGPGIRTTVFLKGCPLRCQWCHNPESKKHEPETDSTGKIWGEEKSVEEIIAVVVQDRAFYEASGGGLTISGGEPLAQPGFTLALLEAARNEGIHTCLDTCGHAPESIFKQTLPWTDLYHFDYKVTGDERHKQLTGVDGTLIRKNLEFLLKHDANIILRCPMVPDVNDQPEHLQAIADIVRREPKLHVELLPYHRLGEGKAAQLGYEPTHFQEADKARIQRWEAGLIAANCPDNRFQINPI